MQTPSTQVISSGLLIRRPFHGRRYVYALEGRRGLLGFTEASALLGVHRVTILRWVSSNRVRTVRYRERRHIPVSGGVGRVIRRSLHQYIERRCTKSTSLPASGWGVEGKGSRAGRIALPHAGVTASFRVHELLASRRDTRCNFRFRVRETSQIL